MKKTELISILILMCGCSKTAPKGEEPVGAVSPDARNALKLSPAEVQALREKANNGDSAAATTLYEYYLLRSDEKDADVWERWLIDHGDPLASERHLEVVFEDSAKLDDHDPKKLELLNEAYKLLDTAQKAPSLRNVMINGNVVEIGSTTQENTKYFGQKVESEYLRIRSIQGK
jgi:hypothetical protein